MKNIHIIPTDKPSRLWVNNLRRRLELDKDVLIGSNTAQHIYITSDEEIKELTNDWFIETDTNEIYKSDWIKFRFNNGKKIILTTDQDLIKDGVQAIGDDFLEWFVKNTSCEEVDVMTDAFTVKEMSMLPIGTRNFKYKIIIPKEEHKQEKMYSEEEVEMIARDAYEMGRKNILIGVFNKWFEQFKNK